MLNKNPLRLGLDWVYKIFLTLQCICMYASVLTIVLTVTLREVFKVGIIWGYEISCWFMILLVFSCMPYNLYKRSNIGVTFFYDLSPKAVQTVFSVIHFVVELACLVMMASGFKIWVTKVGRNVIPACGFTNLAYYGVIGIGVALSFVEMAAEIIDIFVKKPEESEPALNPDDIPLNQLPLEQEKEVTE